MGVAPQSFRYSWTITNIFLVIIFVAHSCVTPFFPLYLKYLRLSVLEMGVIRGIQAWTAVTIPLCVCLAKRTYTIRYKRAIIAVSVFTAIGMCVCLVYVPPQGDPLDVTHCENVIYKKIKVVSHHDKNVDRLKFVLSDVSHNSLLNRKQLKQIKEAADKASDKIQNHVPSFNRNETKSNITSKINSSESSSPAQNTFNVNINMHRTEANKIIEESKYNAEMVTSHLTNLPQASQNLNRTHEEQLFTKSVLNESKLVESVPDIIPLEVLMNEHRTVTFDPSQISADILAKKIETVGDNDLVTAEDADISIKKDLSIPMTTGKFLTSETFERNKKPTSVPFYMFPEHKKIIHENIDIKQNSEKQIFHSINLQDKFTVMKLPQHLQNIQTGKNKIVDNKPTRFMKQYQLPFLITNVNDSVAHGNNIQGSQHVHFKYPVKFNSRKDHNENKTKISFIRKLQLDSKAISEHVQNSTNHTTNKKILLLKKQKEVKFDQEQNNKNIWNKLSKTFFQNNNKDFKNILQHAKTSENINNSSRPKINTMLSHDLDEHFEKTIHYKNRLQYKRRFLPHHRSRPTRASAGNKVEIERLSSRAICNTSLNKSTCRINNSEDQHDSLVKKPNTADIWRLTFTGPKARMHELHNQKSHVRIKADTFNSFVRDATDLQAMNLSVNKNKEFFASKLNVNSQPLSEKSIKAQHSCARHYTTLKLKKKSSLINKNNSIKENVYHLVNNDSIVMPENQEMQMQMLSSVSGNKIMTGAIIRNKHNHNKPSNNSVYNKKSHTIRTLKSIETEIKETENNISDPNGYIHVFPLFHKQFDAWSQVFLTVLLLATFYEVCSNIIRPCVEVFWRQQFDDEENIDLIKTSASLRLWSLLMWGGIGCPALAVLSVMSHCPYQLTFHLVLCTTILFAALLLVLFVLPLHDESSNYPFRKRKPSKPHYMTINLEQEENLLNRFCCALTSVITGLNMACYVEFILWHIESLEGFPYNYEFLYCTYFAVSTLVQLPTGKWLYHWRGKKSFQNEDANEDTEEGEYETIHPHYDLCDRRKGEGRMSPSFSTIGVHALLAIQLALLPLLQSPYAVLLVSPLKGFTDALLESCPWGRTSLARAMGYGIGCFIGGLAASTWGMSYFFWGAATMTFVWSLACALCYGFVNCLWSKLNQPYNRLLLIKEHPVEEQEDESNDWLEVALQKEELRQSKALLK